MGQLGLSGGGTLAQIEAAAHRAGLAVCPPATGPYLRLLLTSQEAAPDSILSAGRPPSGALTVLSEPFNGGDPELPRGFYLRVVDGVSWLRGYRCDDDYVYSVGDEFVLRRPDS